MKRWEVQKAKIYVECPGEKKKKDTNNRQNGIKVQKLRQRLI